MPDQPKINSKKLNDYEQCVRELWVFTQKLEKMFKTLSPQEKVLAGGFVFQVACPWSNLGISIFNGARDTVAGLLGQAVQRMNQPLPKAPPTFEGPKKRPN